MKDGIALDWLARVIKRAGPDGTITEGGEDLTSIVTQALDTTGRSLTYTLATVANMREFEKTHPRETDNVEPPSCVAVSLHVPGEEVSGAPGDYWQPHGVGEDDPLTDTKGEPMILVTKRTEYVDALTGEAI